MGKISKKKRASALHDLPLQENEYIYVSKNQSGYKVLDKATRYKKKKLCISKECINRHQDVIKQYANGLPPNIAPGVMDDNYLSNVKKDQDFVREKEHNVYLVSSPHFSFVKVGVWSNCLSSLACRYRMYYGDSVQLRVFRVHSSREKEEIEKDFICHFKKERVSGELFDKKSYDAYVKFLQKITASDGNLWHRDETISEKQSRPSIRLPLLPPVVVLDNKEMFHFENIVYPLKIRGTRCFTTTFFNLPSKVTEKLFNIKKIKDGLRNYQRGVDYVYFLNKDVNGTADNQSSNNKVLYLTTCGLFKFLGRMKARSVINEVFTQWILQTVIKS